MFEFVEADKALLQEQVNVFIMQSHPQAYYISRKLTEILVQEESQGFDSLLLVSSKVYSPDIFKEKSQGELKPESSNLFIIKLIDQCALNNYIVIKGVKIKFL
ncbi:hypothetical protein RhiirA5_440307 [Rhizophagus irregularis]|uniref:Uncharacterized protein n=1 Tax=Rhizophagus irregularis TaxID=588596 RepID=A0A2N0NGW7_9GLOM|nr:hypothetical protein RhiirA5_440307 [Rhizophagus irregularis]